MKKLIKRLLNDNSGNFAIMFGLALTPILAATATAIDYTGYKRQENRMVIASEAAMLAASKHVVQLREQDYADNASYDTSNDALVAAFESVFRPHFEANFEAGGYALDPDDYDITINEVDLIATVDIRMKYDTSFMPMLGVKEINYDRQMDVNFKVQPKNFVIDIVMCIDATGSMQNTLDGVQAAAQTFNPDLRAELGIGENSEMVKIRTRPIFYRDWEEGRTYQTQMVAYNDYLDELAAYEESLEEYEDELEDYNEAYAAYLEEYEEWESGSSEGTLTDGRIQRELNEWLRSARYRPRPWGWQRSWRHGTWKRFWLDGQYHYFQRYEDAQAFLENYGAGTPSGPAPTPPTAPTIPNPPDPVAEPVNHGLNAYADFLDLDPSSQMATLAGKTKTEMTAQNRSKLEAFLGSTYAFGGHDWPEAAHACMNEALRSGWFDNQSKEARDYFKIPADTEAKPHKIIALGDDIPADAYTMVTQIPVMVFWSDATINSRFDLAKQYLSPTMPTTYTGLKSMWQDPNYINQDRKIFIRFGPQSASGFNTIMGWDRTYYGGSLTVGNDDAVKVIAEKILEAVPQILRVGS